MEANGGGEEGLEDKLAMEANGEDEEGLEDLLAMAMVVLSCGSVAWVPAQAMAPPNGARGAMEAAIRQDAWVPAEAAARTGWIPAPELLVLSGQGALAVALQHGWTHPSAEVAWRQAMGLTPRNGPDNTAAANASMAFNCNPALFLTFLRLPAQEIARCRTVCRGWRDVTSTEAFRRHHHDHHFRTPMPLFFFLDPKLVRLNLRAVDIRDRVSRPIIAYTRPYHEVLRIHGSCAGILLLSSGGRLYACNPCTRRWARLPSIHIHHDIIGFYMTASAAGRGDFEFHVLYHDRFKSNCDYWIFTLGAAAEAAPPARLGRPTRPGLARVLANGIAPSYKIPPVFFSVSGFLHWPPKAAKDNINVLSFETATKSFSWLPPPSIRVGGGKVVPVMARQVFEINQRLAMTVISFCPARVDVWVLGDISELWRHRYSIHVPVNEIKLENSCHHSGSVFAVAQDRNNLVQCPRILLQCDALGDVLKSYEHAAKHWTSLSGHTLQESLLLHPAILPMRGTDAVYGEPPFFPW